MLCVRALDATIVLVGTRTGSFRLEELHLLSFWQLSASDTLEDPFHEEPSCGGSSRPRKRLCIRQTTSSQFKDKSYSPNESIDQNKLDGGAIKRLLIGLARCTAHRLDRTNSLRGLLLSTTRSCPRTPSWHSDRKAFVCQHELPAGASAVVQAITQGPCQS